MLCFERGIYEGIELKKKEKLFEGDSSSFEKEKGVLFQLVLGIVIIYGKVFVQLFVFFENL